MRHTYVAIEHVIQTSVFARHACRIAEDRRFTDWTGQTTSPQILMRDHLGAIERSGAWFARKFDARVDDFFLHAFPAFADRTATP